MLLDEWFGISVENGIKCFDGICKFRDDLVAWDKEIAIGGVVLFLSTFCVRFCLNSMIRAQKKRDQKRQGEKQQKRVERR